MEERASSRSCSLRRSQLLSEKRGSKRNTSTCSPCVFLMSAPLTDQTQPEHGVREANHAGQRRVENGMR